MTDIEELRLGDRVQFTGTVRKNTDHWQTIRYEDAPLPGFTGYKWANGWAKTQNPVAEGVVTGKRLYHSMETDEGIWIQDGVQVFTGYLIAWHLSRNPVIVRLDQITARSRA